jgi:type I restriction enzyme S subunit
MSTVVKKEVPCGGFDCHPDSPPDWQKCPFGELVEVNRDYPMERGREYPFLEMAAVKESFGGIIAYDTRALESSLSRFALNDTLFAKITPCAENGKIAFVDRLPSENGCGSTEFIVLSPRAGFDPFFVYSLASSPAVHSRAVSRMEGSTGRLRVTEETFKKWMWVSVPPDPNEQNRIAEALKAADDHVRALEEQLRKAERVALAVDQSHFAAGPHDVKFPYEYGTARTIQNGWEAKPLGKIADVTSGITLNQDREATENGVRYLTVINVHRGRIDLTEIRHLELRGNEPTTKRIAADDVMVIEGHASAAEIGRAALATEREEGMSFQNHLFRIRVFDRDEMRPRFLVRALNSARIRRHWAATANTSSGLNTINRTALRRLILPIPKPTEQELIIERLEAAEEAVTALRDQLTAARRVKQSLLQNLLTGKIRLKV